MLLNKQMIVDLVPLPFPPLDRFRLIPPKSRAGLVGAATLPLTALWMSLAPGEG
jgi:hypothetical protein